MNERTHFFIKIYLTLYSWKGWCWLCVSSGLETGTDSYTFTPSSSDHSSTSSSSWLGLLNRGSLRTARPQSANKFSRRNLVPNWLQLQLTQAVCVLVIFLFDIHLLPLFLRLFTQMHLLIDCSVEGQYVTYRYNYKHLQINQILAIKIVKDQT